MNVANQTCNNEKKKNYSKPILYKYGSIKLLTQGGSFDRPEGGGVGNMFKKP